MKKSIWSTRQYLDLMEIHLNTSFTKTIALIGMYRKYCNTTNTFGNFLAYCENNNNELISHQMFSYGLSEVFNQTTDKSVLLSKSSAKRMLIKSTRRPLIVYRSLPALINSTFSYIRNNDTIKTAFFAIIMDQCRYNHIDNCKEINYIFDNCYRHLLSSIYIFLNSTYEYDKSEKRREFARDILVALRNSSEMKRVSDACNENL